MLFSNDRVADYINEHFEPAWESVRPVPTVTVDFGNGKTIRRTLRGNIATYVCNSEGNTLDILPGIYEPETYLAQLKQLELLSRWAEQARDLSHHIVQHYHLSQHRSLAEGKSHQTIVARDMSRISIVRVEDGFRYLLMPANEQRRIDGQRHVANLRHAIPNLDSPEELAEWKPLFDDTKRNETTRRMLIHKYLADKDALTPSEITKWLYREVLDADLDDPYLGLGKLLKPKEREQQVLRSTLM